MKKFTMSAIICLLTAFLFTGCAGLLPTTKTTVESPWKTYDEAKTTYEKIIPGKTTVNELKNLGFDPYKTPNIKLLNSKDIINIFMPNPSIRKEDLSEGIQKCIDAKDRCVAYQTEPSEIKIKNLANFWKHMFNFRRESQDYGWRFKGLIIIVDDIVTYKDPPGGEPIIDLKKEQKNPLGPLQNIGDAINDFGRNLIRP